MRSSTETNELTWKEVVESEVGRIFYDAIDDGVRIFVVRGPAAVCAYLGCPKDHPLAGFDYDSIPMQVHGGLTFAGEGKGGGGWPEGWYWYGWDYAHAGDRSTYDDKHPDMSAYKREAKRWLPKEVVAEARDAAWDFRRLMKLAERIALKDSGWIVGKKRD